MIVKDTTAPDIIPRLLALADNGSSDAELLREAADVIGMLRELVGIREEIELEDEEPQGPRLK
jgi:hypothetical protein